MFTSLYIWFTRTGHLLAVPLPLAVGTRVTLSSRKVTAFTLTITAQDLNQAPACFVQYAALVDSGTGWSTLRRRQVFQDSFCRGNPPAPAALLVQLGQPRGAAPALVVKRVVLA